MAENSNSLMSPSTGRNSADSVIHGCYLPKMLKSFRIPGFPSVAERDSFMKPLTVALLTILCAVTAVNPAEAAEPWRAGAAKTVITPSELMWMSGYGSRDKHAEGTLHDLWAKALVLEDPSGEKLLLITLDLVGIDRTTSQEICRRLEKNHGLRRSQIALCMSHTHTGPVVGRNLMAMYSLDDMQLAMVDRYTTFLIDSIDAVTRKAFESMAPAALSYGEGHATFAVNRRTNREADVPALRESGELKGPVDHAVPVLAVKDANGKLLAVVTGYACHATVLSFYQWSGDWPGFAQIEIEKRHPECIALFWAGCGADQNPLPRRTVELAESYGQQLAAAAEDVLQHSLKEVSGKIHSVYQEIDLAFAELPSVEQIEADAKGGDRYLAGRAKQLLSTIEAHGKLSQTYPYPVQIWAIGNDVSMVILGGEVVVDYSLRLRHELAGSNIWVAGYSNDVMAYIPSARVLQEGGYEGATAMIYYGLPTSWSGQVEEHIVKTAADLYSALRSPNQKP
jgi:neutral ceramidase